MHSRNYQREYLLAALKQIVTIISDDYYDRCKLYVSYRRITKENRYKGLLIHTRVPGCSIDTITVIACNDNRRFKVIASGSQFSYSYYVNYNDFAYGENSARYKLVNYILTWLENVRDVTFNKRIHRDRWTSNFYANALVITQAGYN